ncbi:hypothetical protein [Cellulosimicrobium sp. JZ28]|uniref:hypothetical protein n=1 Tax=Cellulosimicrobium sp. JZ28 TaxID=1906273 RepID=UPI00188B76F9|nr:hypothetical protein [Cellulosimicrobium sp. JZ28]
MIRIVCGELVTGKILATVPTTDNGGAWSTVLNDAGTIDATVPLRTRDVRARRELLGYLEPTRCYLAAITDDGDVLEAGPIWKHGFNDNTGELKVGAAGLMSVFDHRLVVKVLAAGERAQTTTLSWSGLSLATIAKRLIQTSMSHAGGSLPLVLPDDELGSAVRNYPGYELGVVGERVRQLVEVAGGPDIALQPRLTGDGLRIEWVMRAGTTADPLLHQAGDDWAWDRGAARGPLTKLSVDVDATGVAQRTWAIGSGMESALMLGTAYDPAPLAAGYPLLEATGSFTSVLEQSTLDAHAAALADTARRPWQTWALTVRADTAPRLGTYRPGDWARVHVPATHEYLREGRYRSRVLSVSGDLSASVSVKLAPTMENR